MIAMVVNIQDNGAREFLSALHMSLAGESANAVAAEAAAERTREHFKALSASRHRPGSSKDYYQNAVEAVVSSADASSGKVSIDYTGLALRRYGGEVKPSGKTSLITGKPIRRLAVPKEGSEAEGRTPYDFRGKVSLVVTKRKKAFLGKPEADGSFSPLFWLVETTHHDPDPSVLPTDDDFYSAVKTALSDLVEEL